MDFFVTYEGQQFCELNGTTQKIKDQHLRYLETLNYSEECINKVIFFADSDEMLFALQA